MDVGLLVTTLVNAKTAGRARARRVAADRYHADFRIRRAVVRAGRSRRASPRWRMARCSRRSPRSRAAGLDRDAECRRGCRHHGRRHADRDRAGAGFVGLRRKKALGTGTLTLSLGNQSFKVDVNGTNTLSGIAAAINSASNNPGVSATVINGTDGAHRARVVEDGRRARSASRSATWPTTTGCRTSASRRRPTRRAARRRSTRERAAAWRQSAVAQDAKFTVSGIASTSAKPVSGVLNGVTLNCRRLRSAQPIRRR